MKLMVGHARIAVHPLLYHLSIRLTQMKIID